MTIHTLTINLGHAPGDEGRAVHDCDIVEVAYTDVNDHDILVTRVDGNRPFMLERPTIGAYERRIIRRMAERIRELQAQLKESV